MECPEKESFAGRASIPDVDQSDVVAVIRLVVLGVDAQPLGGWVTLERTNKAFGHKSLQSPWSNAAWPVIL
jgi:hypothetical protein